MTVFYWSARVFLTVLCAAFAASAWLVPGMWLRVQNVALAVVSLAVGWIGCRP